MVNLSTLLREPPDSRPSQAKTGILRLIKRPDLIIGKFGPDFANELIR